MAKYKQGFFRPDNPDKYKGNPSNIVYRSWWEYRVMDLLDRSKNVIQWSSEEVIIPYRSPIDNRVHRYFTDFYVKKKDFDTGVVEEIIIEVKPKAQTKPPTVKSKQKPTKKYLNEVRTWGVNSAKWDAANKYCENRGWKFVIITEDHIGVLENGSI